MVLDGQVSVAVVRRFIGISRPISYHEGGNIAGRNHPNRSGYKGSILVDYFIRRKHTFDQLDARIDSGNNVEQPARFYGCRLLRRSIQEAFPFTNSTRIGLVDGVFAGAPVPVCVRSPCSGTKHGLALRWVGSQHAFEVLGPKRPAGHARKTCCAATSVETGHVYGARSAPLTLRFQLWSILAHREIPPPALDEEPPEQSVVGRSSHRHFTGQAPVILAE